MKINPTRADILKYANRYDKNPKTKWYRDREDALSKMMKSAAKRGHMTSKDLEFSAKWKWRGAKTWQLCAENSKEDVKEISAASFAANSERLRIGALLALRGVRFPMASTILHFAFPDRYAILDGRSMNTVGRTKPYSFKKWLEYLEWCRKVAKKRRVTMRQLDKALWELNGDQP